MYRENDDIVRAEAVITLMKIYEHRKIHEKYKNTLFSTLNYCVVGDHHTEVKLNALNFWRREFYRQFSNQGMIDGSFPTVTFSKEQKKIVTLKNDTFYSFFSLLILLCFVVKVFLIICQCPKKVPKVSVSDAKSSRLAAAMQSI